MFAALITQVNNQIYPVWTYSYLAALFFVFLVTDKLQYRPVILLEGLACLATRILLIWTGSVLSMQFMQVVKILCFHCFIFEVAYGVSTAADIAYLTNMYTMVEPERYARLTSLFHFSVLAGQTCSGVLAQMLVSLSDVCFRFLYFLTF